MRNANLAVQIAEQQKWIAEHGATLSNYVARYGSANDPRRYGNGGEAIYAADAGALATLEQRANGGRAQAVRS